MATNSDIHAFATQAQSKHNFPLRKCRGRGEPPVSKAHEEMKETVEQAQSGNSLLNLVTG